MLKFIKKKCTEETVGYIKKKRWNGGLLFLTVEYTVDGKVYNVKEQLTYHVTKKHSIGDIPVGIHARSAIQNIEVGASVQVRYNPDKPKQSYLPENEGHHFS